VTPPAGDQARVSVQVAVPAEVAFRVFTEEIDRWWLRGPAYRVAGKQRGIVHFETRLGGRIYESFHTDDETKVYETGSVVVWEPPTRLVFEWRSVTFTPPESTTVEVVFEARSTGTLVTVTHRGWNNIRADHPVRHGHDTSMFVRMIGSWWGALLTSLRVHLARAETSAR
jgi:uncharacterized protein YndB with AHSA1/START domain